MNSSTATAFFLLTLLAVTNAAAPPPSSGGCTDELMSCSPCLSYVSSPPNNLTETASAECCDAFSATVNSLCFCYLLRDPVMLGFPLNTTRLLSLSSLCPSATYSAPKFLCSESPALPPLNGAGNLGITASGGGRGFFGGGRGSSSGKGKPRTGGSSGVAGAAGASSLSHGHGKNGSSSNMACGYKSLLLSLMLAIFVTLTLSSLNTV